jgi:transposase
MFDCAHCGWSKDRQRNAGENLARTVLRETAELGGLRLGLDALSKDVVRPLFPPGPPGGNGRSGRRGRGRSVSSRKPRGV